MSELNITREVNACCARSIPRNVVTNQQELTVETHANVVSLVRLITMKLHHCRRLHYKHAHEIASKTLDRFC
jgi:hypothetical protein